MGRLSYEEKDHEEAQKEEEEQVTKNLYNSMTSTYSGLTEVEETIVDNNIGKKSNVYKNNEDVEKKEMNFDESRAMEKDDTTTTTTKAQEEAQVVVEKEEKGAFKKKETTKRATIEETTMT
jgi:hypothetical protein